MKPPLPNRPDTSGLQPEGRLRRWLRRWLRRFVVGLVIEDVRRGGDLQRELEIATLRRSDSHRPPPPPPSPRSNMGEPVAF
jgi:hypothetical protein